MPNVIQPTADQAVFSDRPECEGFKGRNRDLCEGRGRDGRPWPMPQDVNFFRQQNNLPPLPRRARVILPNGQQLSLVEQQTPKPLATGVGAHMKALVASLGQRYKSGCGCNDVAKAMDDAGPAGCRERFDEFAGKLREKIKTLNWSETLLAA